MNRDSFEVAGACVVAFALCAGFYVGVTTQASRMHETVAEGRACVEIYGDLKNTAASWEASIWEALEELKTDPAVRMEARLRSIEEGCRGDEAMFLVRGDMFTRNEPGMPGLFGQGKGGGR